jgi:MFS family permease
MTLLVRNRRVALIALIVIVAEILGFSCATLFPTFARDVLLSDATGLGLLVAARYAGSIVALLVLARATVGGGRSGRVIVLATLGMGLALFGFAVSRSFGLSLVMLFGVGVASAGIDTSVQSLLQRSVDDTERGAAVGVWYFAIGFGPIGQLALGAAAGAIGPPLALAISGGLLAAIGLALLPLKPLQEPQALPR